MSAVHAELAAGRWQELSLVEQLANIGSEVGRATRAKTSGNAARLSGALDRCLELFDLTLADDRWRGRRREIARAREVVCDFLVGENVHGSTTESLGDYFLAFARAARRPVSMPSTLRVAEATAVYSAPEAVGPYFPSPTTPDMRPPGWDEDPVDYYLRSASPEAGAVRAFLNRSLDHFPRKHARGLIGKLRQDWQSHFFEIIVGRYLQVLGAEIEPSAKYADETNVDYRATFPDGISISVECVSKRFNEAARAEMKHHGNMTRMLDAIGPPTWVISIRELPSCRSAAEFKTYVDRTEAFYSTLPAPLDGGPRIPFQSTGDQGTLRIEAIPFPEGTMANHIGPAVGFMDNSVQRVKAALIDSHKRKQARAAMPPVFLAVDSPFMGPDAGEFDRALYGQTVDHRGLDPNANVGYSFNPNGVLVTDKEIPFAGVIAFLGMRMTGASDPILYLNPYQRWRLPSAIAAHERRVWTSRIDREPATREPLIARVGFIQYPGQ